MGLENNKKESSSKVTRHQYEVLHAKNFGEGVIQPGKTVELSQKAGDFYQDRGFVKPTKK